MEDLLQQLTRETLDDLFDTLSAGEILQHLKPKKVEELIKQAPPEERLKGLSVDAMLAALSPEMRAELVQRLKDDRSPPNPGGQ